jgi:hypothetical protein
MSYSNVKVCIGLSYFDSFKELRRINQTLPRWMPIIGIDGRYKLYPSDHDYSTDGSTEFLSRRPYTTIEQFSGDQIDKRQRYLDIAGDLGYDYVIVMDTDEYIQPGYDDWDLFLRQLETIQRLRWDDYIFKIWIWIQPEDKWKHNGNTIGYNIWHEYNRIMKDPGNLKYYLTHYTWRLKDDNSPGVDTLKSYYSVDGVRFTADSLLRTPQWLANSNKWAMANMQHERVRIWMQKKGLNKFADKVLVEHKSRSS